IRVEVTVDPANAITEVLGARPTSQRERLQWDHAVESIAVYREQTGWSPSPDARTLDEVIGPRPANGIDRMYYDSVVSAIDQTVLAPEADRGLELDLGLP